MERDVGLGGRLRVLQLGHLALGIGEGVFQSLGALFSGVGRVLEGLGEILLGIEFGGIVCHSFLDGLDEIDDCSRGFQLTDFGPLRGDLIFVFDLHRECDIGGYTGF